MVNQWWHRLLIHHRPARGGTRPTDSKVYGRQKRGVKILCVAAEVKNRGQKSICGHKKGGKYSMSHWKIGVKIGPKKGVKSWEGQNSMKAKIWGSKFYFFLVEPLVKILCSLKRGVKILYFFQVPWKRGVKTAEPTNQLHWRGAPPGRPVPVEEFNYRSGTWTGPELGHGCLCRCPSTERCRTIITHSHNVVLQKFYGY